MHAPSPLVFRFFRLVGGGGGLGWRCRFFLMCEERLCFACAVCLLTTSSTVACFAAPGSASVSAVTSVYHPGEEANSVARWVNGEVSTAVLVRPVGSPVNAGANGITSLP
jgi:hypothetical protein